MVHRSVLAQLREQAIALRRAGRSRREIKELLGMNTGDGYHGCLRIDVLRSTDLYRRIEGWASAAMTGRGGPRQTTTSGHRAG
jgi:hypothetical protein